MNLKRIVKFVVDVGAGMKLRRILSGSVFALLFGYAVFGGVDLAHAQSICSCPPARPISGVGVALLVLL
jgi:hypothetical protein